MDEDLGEVLAVVLSDLDVSMDDDPYTALAEMGSDGSLATMDDLNDLAQRTFG